MLPETEKLFQTWLKIQIWQFRIFVFRWIFMLFIFVIGIIGFFGFALPAFKTEFAKLDKIQGQLLNLSETTQKQGQFLDELKSIKEGQGIFDIFTK